MLSSWHILEWSYLLGCFWFRRCELVSRFQRSCLLCWIVRTVRAGTISISFTVFSLQDLKLNIDVRIIEAFAGNGSLLGQSKCHVGYKLLCNIPRVEIILNLKCSASCKWNSLSALVQPIDHRSCSRFSSYPAAGTCSGRGLMKRSCAKNLDLYFWKWILDLFWQ